MAPRTASKEPPAPARAMSIHAHPDDQEFTVAGTLAKWARAGCEIVSVCITSGGAGSNKYTPLDMTRHALVPIREDEQREPRLSDLRESGSIEQDAHMVIFPVREPPLHESGPAKLLIAKNRGGRTGEVECHWDAPTMSFLGIGLRPPVVSWGVMLNKAINIVIVINKPWMLLPGLAIFITILAFNFLGDGLRDAADPYHV